MGYVRSDDRPARTDAAARKLAACVEGVGLRRALGQTPYVLITVPGGVCGGGMARTGPSSTPFHCPGEEFELLSRFETVNATYDVLQDQVAALLVSACVWCVFP